MNSTLNTLKPNIGSRKKKLRKGRGIAAGQGASCGFGMRGQKSRSGRPTRPGFEGGQMPLYRRVPKLKHFEIINQKNFSIVNLSKLSEFKEAVRNVLRERSINAISKLQQKNVENIAKALEFYKKNKHTDKKEPFIKLLKKLGKEK